MKNNYVVLHCHTMLSSATTNIDSVTSYEDYIKKASELNMSHIAITEHGQCLNWLKKKETCEKYGVKYIHSVEAYITETLDEKIRDNYHCCLYAKNWNGVKELNKLISNSFNRKDNHYYYTPRILIDDLINTSENIIVASACLGGIFSKGNESIKERFLQFYKDNKDRCYLEIQHHDVVDQITYNRYLYKLSKEYNLKLVASTDTHCLDKKHEKGRAILQKSKNIYFDNEEGWDLTFKSYDELVAAYEKQDSLPMDVVLEAINNTNIIANQIEDFKIDRSYKYPKMHKDAEQVLIDKIAIGIKEKGIDKYDNFESEYIPRIKEELETYKHNGAIDFLLLDEDIKTWARNSDIYPGYSRGSCSGSIICYLIGITEIDSIVHKLNFQRFMNTERISLADIDTDWSPSDRDKVKEYIYSKDGLYCADIITFNTVALKGSIRDVGRALDMKLSDIDNICKNIEDSEDEYRKKYKELFEYVDIINGTIVSIGTHPCGIAVSPIPLDENMGLITLGTCDNPVTMLNMKEIDSLNYVKLDVLGLDNVELINETCKLANIERLTPQNVDDEDENVWKSIRENTLGIFQWDGSGSYYIKDLFSDETISKIKTNVPDFKYMDLFSCGNGAIRPAGSSYRNELSHGVFKDNGHKALNELLKPTLGFLVYQEQILDFLHKFCGYTMGEADMIRRGFAKKTGTEQYIPEIENGFIKTMKEKYGMDEEESKSIVKSFITVIMDASDYLFSLNHSESYSYIGYICGYLRYYYPLEFLTVLLNINNGDIEKTKKTVEYAEEIGIGIKNHKFRYSKADYFMDKETNSIYRGIGSIKFLNNDVADYLYELRDKQYDTFTELLIDLQGHINSRQLEILIKLNFFEEFGKTYKLLSIVEAFNKLYGKKQFKIDNAYVEYIKLFAKTQTDKTLKDVNTKELCEYIENRIENNDLPVEELIQSHYEFVGNCTLTDEYANPRHCVAIKIDTKYTPKVTFYNIKSGRIKECKISKNVFKDNPFELYDLVYLEHTQSKPKRKLLDGKWVATSECEMYVNSYWKVLE